MVTSADQRLLQLLDTWLASLELHLKYASLDAESYARVQPWPPHQRPNAWIIDIARQKALALKALIEDRVQMGDGKFADALEMTIFLANLVGVQHIERFIPLADKAAERVIESAASQTGSMSLTTIAPINLPERLASAVTGTREMPQFVAKTRAPPPAGTAHVARAERKGAVPPVAADPEPVVEARPKKLISGDAPAHPHADAEASGRATPGPRAGARAGAGAPPSPGAAASAANRTPTTQTPTATASPGTRAPRGVARAAQKASAAKPPVSAAGTSGAGVAAGAGGAPSDEARAKVVADAERLLQWGRRWYELAELIARMADRPSLTQVRRILKENKPMLDAKFKR
jgi:hypothetical protein